MKKQAHPSHWPSTPQHSFYRFVQDVTTNKFNKAILDRWDCLYLPDGWLVAGCLFQTVWNLHSNAVAEAQIRDYDIFYFDATDLSEEAERGFQARVDDVLGDLGVLIEVKNQARVHLWYPEHFGYPYPQLQCSTDGIDRFLVTATCIGLRPSQSGLNLYAPHGLSLLYQGLLEPNPLTNHRDLFEQKSQSYRSRWPWLRVGANGT